MKNIKFKAFTLGEVMITMVVVGVVAMLSFPVLNKTYKRNVMQTNFVDSMKTVNQSLFNYSSSVGSQGKLATSGLFSNGVNSAQRLSTVFKSATATNDCWQGQSIDNNFSGGGGTTNLSAFNCFTDVSGKIFAIQSFNNSCTTNLGQIVNGNQPPRKLSRACGYIYIDENGITPPNRFGYDVFIFVITDNPQTYLYPVGGAFWVDNTNFNGVRACTVNGEGRTCAGRIIEDNMKIKYFN